MKLILSAASLFLATSLFSAGPTPHQQTQPSSKVEIRDLYDETDELAIPLDQSEYEDEEELDLLRAGSKQDQGSSAKERAPVQPEKK